MNRQETAQVLAYLVSAWPDKDLPDETVEVWAQQLAGTDPEFARRAAAAVVSDSKWFPTVAEFREACGYQARRHDLERRPGLPAGESWSAESNLARLRDIKKRILVGGERPCDVMGQPLCRECSSRGENHG